MDNPIEAGLIERLCDHCGHPEYRHVGIYGVGKMCPASGFTFTTAKADALEHLSQTVNELREALERISVGRRANARHGDDCLCMMCAMPPGELRNIASTALTQSSSVNSDNAST